MSDMQLPKGLATHRLRAIDLEADNHTDLGELITVRGIAGVSKVLGQECRRMSWLCVGGEEGCRKTAEEL